MDMRFRLKRVVAMLLSFAIMTYIIIVNSPTQEITKNDETSDVEKIVSESEVLSSTDSKLAINALAKIEIKGRAPKTGYSRSEFGSGWETTNGCDTRNIILNRDLTDVKFNEKCLVLSGILNDPYTGKIIHFTRGTDTSDDIQIDHVVALGDAWQKGAQLLTKEKRVELANDHLELLAVSGDENQNKSDGDAATWLPPNKAFRCQYVARQIAVKQKYNLWIAQAEHDVMKEILSVCPNQLVP